MKIGADASHRFFFFFFLLFMYPSIRRNVLRGHSGVVFSPHVEASSTTPLDLSSAAVAFLFVLCVVSVIVSDCSSYLVVVGIVGP